MTAPLKRRRRKKKRDPFKNNRYKAPPLHDVIKCAWCNGGKEIRLTIAENLVGELERAHRAMFGFMYHSDLVKAQFDFRKLMRIEFMKFEDTGIPGLFIRVEPPTFYPLGHKLWRRTDGRSYFTQHRALPLGIKENMPSLTLEYIYEPSMPGALGGGMLLIFPDEYMAWSPRKGDRSAVRAKPRVVRLDPDAPIGADYG